MLVLCDATVVLINHIHSAIQSLQNRFHLQLFTYMTLNKFTVKDVSRIQIALQYLLLYTKYNKLTSFFFVCWLPVGYILITAQKYKHITEKYYRSSQTHEI